MSFMGETMLQNTLIPTATDSTQNYCQNLKYNNNTTLVVLNHLHSLKCYSHQQTHSIHLSEPDSKVCTYVRTLMSCLHVSKRTNSTRILSWNKSSPLSLLRWRCEKEGGGGGNWKLRIVYSPNPNVIEDNTLTPNIVEDNTLTPLVKPINHSRYV